MSVPNQFRSAKNTVDHERCILDRIVSLSNLLQPKNGTNALGRALCANDEDFIADRTTVQTHTYPKLAEPALEAGKKVVVVISAHDQQQSLTDSCFGDAALVRDPEAVYQE